MVDAFNLLSVIIPVRNEAKTIEAVINSLFIALSEFNIEVIVVENNSSDETITILNKLKLERPIVLISDSMIAGKGEAVLQGLKKASGTYVLIQDADMEYNVSDIIPLYKECLLHDLDAILGNRFESTTFQNSKAKINFLGNRFITDLFNSVHYTNLSDVETGYKIIKRSILPVDFFESKKFEIEIELVAYLKGHDRKMREMPISYTPRSKNEGKKIGFIDGLSALFHIFYFKLKFTKNKKIFIFPIKKRSLHLLLFSFVLLNTTLLFIEVYKTLELPWPIRRLQIDGGSYLKGVDQIIKSGNWFSIKDLYHSPGFQLYLIPFFKLLTPTIFYKIANILLVLMTLFLSFKIATRLMNTTFSLVAVVLISFSAQIQGYSSTLQPEILMMFLFTFLAFFLLKNPVKLRDQVLIGVASFFLVLIQVRLLPVFLLLLFVPNCKKTLKKVSFLIFIILSFCWCGIQTYYNQKFIFFGEGSAFRFLMAYNPNASGASFPYPTVVEPSGWNFIMSHPLDTFGLFIKRYCYLWNLKKDIWDLGNPLMYKLTGDIVMTPLDLLLHFFYFLSFHLCLAFLFFTKKLKTPSVYFLICLIFANFLGPILIFSSSRFFVPTLPLVCLIIAMGLQEIVLVE